MKSTEIKKEEPNQSDLEVCIWLEIMKNNPTKNITSLNQNYCNGCLGYDYTCSSHQKYRGAGWWE